MNLAVLHSAERKTGLTQWGDPAFMEERLDAWQRAVADDSGLNERGKAEVEAFTLAHACNRLRLEHLIARHPEIESIELEPPVVVTGLPRSGATAIALSLSRGLDRRWLARWEAVEPFSGFDNAKRAFARRQHEKLVQIAPRLAQMHDSSPDAFVDDTELQCLAFGSYALEWHAHVPGWRDYYLGSDQAPVYRYLKRSMQALSWLRGSTRWLIKSPQHMEQLPALASVFPDARLVVVRRERQAAHRSIGRVMEAMGAAFRRRDYPRNYWRERFDTMLSRFEVAKHLFPGRVEIDISEDRQALLARLA